MAQQTVTETSGLTHTDVVTTYNANATDAESRMAANATAITGKQATLISGTNIKTVNGTSLLGSGDLAVSSGLAVVAGTDAAVTMLVNRHYELAGSILTADRTYKLTSASVGDRQRVSLTTGNNSFALIIQGDTGISINGGTAASEWSRIRNAREFVEFRATSTTNWDVWSDGRLRQRAKMRQNASQSFTHDTATKIAMDATLRDNSNISDLANDRFTVFRSGTYRVTARASLQSLAATTRVLLYVSANGALVDLTATFMSPTTNAAYPLIVSEVDLTAGQYVEAFMSWDIAGGSGTKSSFVASDLIKPVFSIEEML